MATIVIGFTAPRTDPLIMSVLLQLGGGRRCQAAWLAQFGLKGRS